MAHLAGSHASLPPGHRPGLDLAQPFRSAEEAWFWTIGALTARQDGVRSTSHPRPVMRPCEPDDVINCLNDLYRSGRIDLRQARTLRRWGDRRVAPDPRSQAERPAAAAWQAALASLEQPLRVKGIVA